MKFIQSLVNGENHISSEYVRRSEKPWVSVKPLAEDRKWANIKIRSAVGECECQWLSVKVRSAVDKCKC